MLITNIREIPFLVKLILSIIQVRPPTIGISAIPGKGAGGEGLAPSTTKYLIAIN